MNFIDTHAHLDDKSLQEIGLQKIINEAKNAGVNHIIAPASNLESARKLAQIAREHEEVYFAAGIHAHEAEDFKEENINEIKNLLSLKKAVAIGEVGLDYHYDFSPREKQKLVLLHFLNLSQNLNLPLILHCREAEEDMYKMLQSFEGRLRGVIHCYTGGEFWAEKFLGLGFYIGFTGFITFKKSEETRKVIAKAALDRILTETDSPYMTPVPYRGRINQPALVKIVAEKIAEIRETPIEKIAPQLLKNAEKCFGISIS